MEEINEAPEVESAFSAPEVETTTPEAGMPTTTPTAEMGDSKPQPPARKAYKVMSPLSHGGKMRHEGTTVQLTDQQAELHGENVASV